MPYITKGDRARLATNPPAGPGELNYLITVLISDYWSRSSHRYQDLNDIVGALESAKAEFQRRIVVPYEDRKIAENGDVYE